MLILFFSETERVLIFHQFCIIEIFDGHLVLQSVFVMLSLGFSLTKLGLAFFSQSASHKGLVHLLVGVKLVNVIRGRTCRRDGSAHVVKICSTGDHSLVAKLRGDISAHCGADLELVLSHHIVHI